MGLYEKNVDHFGVSTDHEISPNEIYNDLYKYSDFIKNKIADPFPP